MIDVVEDFKNKEHKEHCSKYTFVPFIYPKVDRIIVFGDIHGDYEMAIKLLQMANLARIVGEKKISRSKINRRKRSVHKSRNTQDGGFSTGVDNYTDDGIEYELEWIGGNTHLVQVGDQIDRCRPNGTYTCDNPRALDPDGDEDSDVKILKLFTNLHEQAVTVGGAVISLLGNHELLNSLGEVQYVSFKGLKNILIKYKVEGIEFEDGIEARKHAFKPGNVHGKFMGCTRNATVVIGSNLFVHAGIIDTLIKELRFTGRIDLENINILIKKWLLGLIQTNQVSNIVKSANSMFWTRILGRIPSGVPMDFKSCKNNISEVLKLFNVDKMIIGHTPQSFLLNKDINGTCGNKIWRVDNGASSAFDMFDEHYKNYKEKHHNRRFQYLEILNDTDYHVYDENGRIY